MNKQDPQIRKIADECGLPEFLVAGLLENNPSNNRHLLKQLRKELSCRIVL